MRFPRLSHLFHRRAKSDTALVMLPAILTATTVHKSVSAPYIDELVANEPRQDPFAHYIPAVPLSIPHDAHNAVAQPPAAVDTFTHFHSDPYTRPHTTVTAALMQRIRELETELQRQYELNMCIPTLNDALHAERAAADSAQQANARLNVSFSALQADLLRAQTSLQALHVHPPLLPGNSDHVRVLAAENATLVAERIRHRKFIELMVSAGGHKPVLDQAYRAVEDGAEPEAALIEAIRESLTRPESVWAALLEPVMGPRTQEEYKAQVRCTLGARKDARAWKKRAIFWKSTAKEDGAHVDTVTPSPSDIPSIAEDISPGRKRAVEQLIESRRNVTLPLAVHTSATANLAVARAKCPIGQIDLSFPAIPSSTTISDIVAPVPSTLTTMASSLHEAETVVLPVTVADSSNPNGTSAYANLAPLASETFRAAHSIRSMVSCHSSIFSISLSRSLSGSASVSAMGTRTLPASVSAAAQSNASAKGRHRQEKAVSVTQQSSDSFTLTKNEPRTSESDNPSVPASSSACSDSGSPASVPLSSVRAVSPAPLTNSSTKETLASVDTHSGASSSSGPSILHSPNRGRRSTISDGSDADTSDESLVIIMHSELDGVRAPSTPEPISTSSSGSGSGSSTARTPSPGKRSRLPVPVLRKAIRRLSISRPVLVGTTNLGTFSFATERRGTAQGQKDKDTQAAKGKSRAKAGKHGENRSMGRADEVAKDARSPSRATKIPMGQRIHQNLVGTARRAVHKTKSATS